ncbi:antitoxin Xre/MbcA/ParS toxin-binding domain-containing protein [Stenotrophomonas rhizophila]|uniref:antitoxin Xre/MbcA/ParS toxin-binding domain-containing protein n=1 Tax=Stenotrophomonas rhizophila TaxID=216778 RepID=UPI0010C04ADD|nr:antitoxin Xre/MbcA/ParS toxin-binding domain-containing protein [Stenotrophomonas rhizophila]TKK07552.1 hypothetical protein SrhCFBP13529_12330 [Stenotrophomonas rhizophila]
MPQLSVGQTEDVKGAAIRTFMRISQAWRLSDNERLQILAVPDLPRSDEDGEGMVDDSVLARIGYILSIYRALHTLFPDAAQADTWIHRANSAPLFGGEPAIRLLCSGDAGSLEAVRDYLELQLG